MSGEKVEGVWIAEQEEKLLRELTKQFEELFLQSREEKREIYISPMGEKTLKLFDDLLTKEYQRICKEETEKLNNESNN